MKMFKSSSGIFPLKHFDIRHYLYHSKAQCIMINYKTFTVVTVNEEDTPSASDTFNLKIKAFTRAQHCTDAAPQQGAL